MTGAELRAKREEFGDTRERLSERLGLYIYCDAARIGLWEMGLDTIPPLLDMALDLMLENKRLVAMIRGQGIGVSGAVPADGTEVATQDQPNTYGQLRTSVAIAFTKRGEEVLDSHE